ncbi:MAG: transposase [Kineosporiaceae bacterium]|nr:transposase [Kineosporiaceae bacterium]
MAVLSGVGGLVASASFAMTAAGIAALAGWLVEVGVPLSRIGVEGSAGLGMQVATALGALGYDVREVPANRTALRRRRRTRAKSDTHDAIAIARGGAGRCRPAAGGVSTPRCPAPGRSCPPCTRGGPVRSRPAAGC